MQIHRPIALLAVVLLFGVWWLATSEPAAPQTPHGTAAPKTPLPSSAVGSALPVAPVSADRAAVDAGPNAGAVDIDRERDLHGVVCGPDAQPLGGARVIAELSEIEEYPLLDRGARASRRVVGETETDAGGRYRLPLAAGRQHRVQASASGLPPQVRSGCRAGARVDFQLEHGATLIGTVRAEGSGAAVARTRILLRKDLAVGAAGVGEAVTDAAGAFRIDGLPSGTCLVDVRPETLASPRDFEVVLRAGETTVHDILLTAGITIRGCVLDAATREGIAGAEVGEGIAGRSVRTEAGGAFELVGFEAHDNYTLRAHAAGYAHAEVMLRGRGSTAADTATQVEILLSKGNQVRGVVADATGRALPMVYVGATAADHGAEGGGFRSDWRTTETDRNGAFAIDDLRRDMQHTLLVVHPGFATAVYEFPADEAERSVIDLGELRLQPPASLRGELKDERGAPIADYEVVLRGHNADRFRFGVPPPDGYRVLDSYVAARHCQTDDRGRFQFADLAAGKYVIGANKIDSHEEIAVERTLAAGEQASGVVLQVVRGLSIEGTVFVMDGGRLPKCYCSIDPEDGQATSGDVEVRADGAFRAAGLSPGNYKITVYPYASEEDRAVSRSFESREHQHIAAGSVGVRLEVPVRGPLRGVVYDALRAPVAGAWLGVVDGDVVLGSEQSDAAGAFALAVPVGREVTVVLCALSPPGAANVFDRTRAVASTKAAAGGPAIELVLPR
jgi:hypothetical protein